MSSRDTRTITFRRGVNKTRLSGGGWMSKIVKALGVGALLAYVGARAPRSLTEEQMSLDSDFTALSTALENREVAETVQTVFARDKYDGSLAHDLDGKLQVTTSLSMDDLVGMEYALRDDTTARLINALPKVAELLRTRDGQFLLRKTAEKAEYITTFRKKLENQSIERRKDDMPKYEGLLRAWHKWFGYSTVISVPNDDDNTLWARHNIDIELRMHIKQWYDNEVIFKENFVMKDGTIQNVDIQNLEEATLSDAVLGYEFEQTAYENEPWARQPFAYY